MTPLNSWRTAGFAILTLAFSLGLYGSASAQISQVNVMPGTPQGPRTEPHPARPGVGSLVWGNCNSGNAIAVGWNYCWSFAPNPNVLVNDDGSLCGVVTDPKFIVEEVTFLLLGSTRETVQATLTVNDGSTSMSKTVFVEIFDPSDPVQANDVDRLQIDVNIAIENGLRRLYLQQNSTGEWGASSPVAETGFALWAFGNKKHQPTTPIADEGDIYAEFVQDGLNFLFSNAVAAGTVAPNADVIRGATAPGVSDLNGNGRSINLAPAVFDHGYQHPIATAGIIASLSPTRVITVGPFAGETYKTFLEDSIDHIGIRQNFAAISGTRGGWTYNGPSITSDMSINSWMFVALEGAEITNYAVAVPDWIKQESEYCLVFHQVNVTPRQFGYTSSTELIAGHGRATTSGGLSGLALVETVTTVPVGAIFAAEPAPLNTVTAKRDAAVEYLGIQWDVDAIGAGFGSGNRNNFYTMWTTARALRLTASATAVPKVSLINSGVSFDWEFGEEAPSPGLVPGYGLAAAAPSAVREGYFNWLVRKQDNTNASLPLRGRWSQSTFMNGHGSSYETSLGVLVLIPEVFATDDCMQIVEREVLCDPLNPGQYTVSFEVTNSSGVTAQHIVMPATTTLPGAPTTVSPNVIALVPPLLDGETRTITLTLNNAPPGTTCWRIALLDSELEECCSTEVCVVLPDCDCLQVTNQQIICDPDVPGKQIYTFTIRNVSTVVSENTFILGNPALPAGVVFTPDSFNYPPLNPGESITLSTSISGATDGQTICFQLTLHDALLDECCFKDHCITIPDCTPSVDPCITELNCEVNGDEVRITWTPPVGDLCCAVLTLTLPDGSILTLPSAFDGFFSIGPCMPGEYILTCSPEQGMVGTPVSVSCFVTEEECSPDPCLPDMTCQITADGLEILWTPAAGQACCSELTLSLDGTVLVALDPFSGSYVIPFCKKGIYTIQCIDAAGIPGPSQSCTVNQDCQVDDPPVFTTSPLLEATIGELYVYDFDAYDPDPFQTFTFELTTAPAGVIFDLDLQRISWTPQNLGEEGFVLAVISVENPTFESMAGWSVNVLAESTTTQPDTTQFLRGDCSVDGSVDIADAIRILDTLFGGSGQFTCVDSCDVDDSGAINIVDAVALLSYLIGGNTLPFTTLTDCDLDSTIDDLDCATHAACNN